MAEATGSTLAERYRLDGLVGQGGMGRVWHGHDQLLDRAVAVKEIVLPDGIAAEQRRELVERAMREARAAARLHHPGIITVHDVVLHDGKPWIIMEFISGHSLAQRIARAGKLDWEQVADIGAALADALANAHEAGIVHRDLKPDNVLLDGRRVVITDFGIARILDASLRLTSSAVLVGTPQYMPPEQLDGKPVEAPGDLWALGATLYCAVEGRPPFDGSTLSAVWAAILTRPLSPSQHAGPLTSVLADLMSKEPGQRPSAHTAAARLTALQRPHPPSGTGGSSPMAADPLTGPARDTVSAQWRPAVSAPGQARSPAGAVASGSRPTARHVHTLDGQHASVHAVAFSPDGRLLATADNLGGLMLWDTTAPSPGKRLRPEGRHGFVSHTAIAFSRDGRLLAVSGGEAVQLWDPASVVCQRTLSVPHDRSLQVRHTVSLSFTPDGQQIAAFCAADQKVWLWDAATGQSKTSVRLRTGITESLRKGRERYCVVAEFSPGMNVLATYNGDAVQLWDPLSGKRQRSITGNDPKVSAIAFSHDGHTVAVRSTDDTTRLWDSDTGRNVLTFKGNFQAAPAGFALSDQLVATGGAVAIQLWDTTTGRHLQSITPPTHKTGKGNVTCLAFSPDGRLLAACETISITGRNIKPTDFPAPTHLWELTDLAADG